MIEIKLTCDTVAEAQHEMAALLRGSNIISGWEPKAIVPAAPTPPVAETGSATTPATTPAVHSVANETSIPSSTTGSSSALSPDEQPKRGRGRPRKEPAPTAAAEPGQVGGPVPGSDVTISSESAAEAGNAPTPETGATAPAEPASDAASSTSSEPVTAQDDAGNGAASADTPLSSDAASTPANSPTDGTGPSATTDASLSEQPLVTDSELQRYCARVSAHFGGPQKVFDACKPYLGEGEVARPTNIKRNEDRWLFIRAMEIESGLTYHG